MDVLKLQIEFMLLKNERYVSEKSLSSGGLAQLVFAQKLFVAIRSFFFSHLRNTLICDKLLLCLNFIC